MDVSIFDFELPEERIALRPANPRDSARMLVVRQDGSLTHARVRDLPDFLGSPDVFVVNDTKVIHARLRGRRTPRAAQASEGPKIELLFHRRLDEVRWLAFSRPARKLDVGDTLLLGKTLEGHVIRRGEGGEVEVAMRPRASSPHSVETLIATEGEVPLPPYIAGKRAADSRDETDYQTMFAARKGSVAAPTAGLHFTPELLRRMEEKGIARTHVTLHVGAGTFLPVNTGDTDLHRMHAEWAEVTAATADALNEARDGGGRIVAVGTTTLRTLEASLGARTPSSALDAEGSRADEGVRPPRIFPWSGETSLFITPGYQFRTAEVLLTNFHLPRSTLFMLVSAFAGLETMKQAYAHAVASGYRSYSYGDASLLFRAPAA